MDRRKFIKLTGTATLSFGLMKLTGCESSDFEVLTSGAVRPFITANEDFYIQFGAGTTPDNFPNVNMNNWTLSISDLVSNPQTFDWNDLQTFAQTEEITYLKTMRCVFDSQLGFEKFISNAYWTGVPLKVLLDQVGVDPAAKRLRIRGSDGFENNILISDVNKTLQPDELPIILCYQMNGEDLPIEHGFPVRVVFPEKFGYKNMKWIESIELTDQDVPFGTYEVDLGIFDAGDLQPISYITAPALSGEEIRRGIYILFGTALTGDIPPAKVEVKVENETGGAFDSGDWVETEIIEQSDLLAELETHTMQTVGRLPSEFIEQVKFPAQHNFPYKNVWVIWQHPIEVVGTGRVRISVRVTDALNNTQPDVDDDIETDSDTSVLSVIARKI